MKKWIITAVVLLLLLVGTLYLGSYSLETIKVSGCENVDEQVILDAIEARHFSGNTLLLSIGNKIKPIKDIPFVAKVEIEIVSKNEIIVMVYEKSMAGCVEYMNSYVYFDKDGIILDVSSESFQGVPCIKGLNFESWEIGEELPIDDKTKFQNILSITQLIEKYQLDIDGIRFTSENEIILIHDKIDIELGTGENLAIQMMNLGSILEGLEGKEGVLYMKDFDSENGTASFSNK